MKIDFGANVEIGNDPYIGEYVLLGVSRPDKETSKLIIRDNAIIRSHTVIYYGNRIGDNLRTGHGVLIRENNEIGHSVSIGSHSVIESHNKIGNNVRIHSNCFIPEFVIIEDDVWIGPSVTILNILHPPCPSYADCVMNVRIKKNAKIGGNVTIGPRVTVGSNSLIGMGSVVTADIPDNVLAFGNPARVIKPLSELTCELELHKMPYEWERG